MVNKLKICREYLVAGGRESIGAGIADDTPSDKFST